VPSCYADVADQGGISNSDSVSMVAISYGRQRSIPTFSSSLPLLPFWLGAVRGLPPSAGGVDGRGARASEGVLYPKLTHGGQRTVGSSVGTRVRRSGGLG